MTVVGLLINLVPYQHARWRAFAQASGTACVVVELTNKDEFSVLEISRTEDSPYERKALFPRATASSLAPAAIRREISRVLDAQRPVCVCLNGYASPLALGALGWCLRHRVPAVLMSESTVWDEPRKPWKEWLKSRVCRLCSSALAGGAPQADYLVALGMPRARVFLGYDAVDNDHFASGAKQARDREPELRKKHGLPEKYFLASARFSPKKNLPRLLEAYGRYRNLFSSSEPSSPAPWDLVVLGDGAGRDDLLALRAKLGLERHVHFAGAKPYPDLPIYYGLASAFVHASTTEQWGLVINEAMASGLPVLVSRRCGSAQDLVQEGVNGFTFDPFDLEDMAQKMSWLTSGENELAAFGKASRDIVGKWSPERFAAGLNQAIEAARSNSLPRFTWFDRLLVRVLQSKTKT